MCQCNNLPEPFYCPICIRTNHSNLQLAKNLANNSAQNSGPTNLPLANNLASPSNGGPILGLNSNLSGLNAWIPNGKTFVEYQWTQEEINYMLFQKYAELSDQQIIETYYQDLEKLEEQHQQAIKLQESSFKYKQDELHKQLIEWCAKYRKHLTEERIKAMKAYL